LEKAAQVTVIKKHNSLLFMNKQISKKWYLHSCENFQKGLHVGQKALSISHSPSWHPLMSNYVLGVRHNRAVGNIQQTQKALLRAFYILAQISFSKGDILIINTNPEFSHISSNFQFYMQGRAQNSTLGGRPSPKSFLYKQIQGSLSFSNFKWTGGTLTNWKQVSKSVLTFGKFSERCEGFLNTKALNFPKYKKIKRCYQGLLYKKDHKMFLSFTEKPDVIFLMNPSENQNIIHEATLLHIPIIAFTQSHTDLKGIDYPLPGNTSSLKFFYFCLKKISKLSSTLAKRKTLPVLETSSQRSLFEK
jgi:small subunit ribosomal protein S2